jgi:uncharacterized protein (TIGR02246 family)
MRIVLAIVLLTLVTSRAFADVPAEVRAHEDAFARACQAGDVDGVVALYADDAIVIWPGQGEEAKGKADVAKLATGLCKNTQGLKLTITSLQARALGADHIGVVGHWEISSIGADGKAAAVEMRATEVLRRSGGRLLYLFDHGSIGVPASPSADAPARTP